MTSGVSLSMISPSRSKMTASTLRIGAQGKTKPHRGEAVGAQGARLSAVRPGDLLDDREPDPRAARLARSGLLAAVEPFEDARHVFRGDPLAGVGHREPHGPTVAARR